VGVAQVGATVGDVAANLRLARRYVRRAASRGCDLVVFPECFVQGYSIRSEILALAETSDGEAAAELRALVAETGVAIVCGFLERNPADPAHPFNAALVVGAGGEPAGVYRKTHLFEREHEAFARGDGYPVFDLALGSDASRPRVRVGVSICADIEYPEVARMLALGGAQLLAVPSADMEPYRAQQAANLASRAIENNLYVALANTVDRRRGVTFFGGSGIAGPDGSLVSAGYLRPRLVIATLSDAAVEASGGRGAYLRARRPDTYVGLLATSALAPARLSVRARGSSCRC